MDNYLKPHAEERYRIFLADECPIVLKGLSAVLLEQTSFLVCGQASDPEGAVQGVKWTKPHLAILEIAMAGSDSFHFLQKMLRAQPGLPVLVCSVCDEMSYAAAAFRAGARGFIRKQAPIDELMLAIRQVLSGGNYFNPKVQMNLLKTWLSGKPDGQMPLDELTERQMQVFALIGQGYKTSEIAKELRLSVKTIETYCAQIKGKIHARNSTHLALQAVRWLSSQKSAGSACSCGAFS